MSTNLSPQGYIIGKDPVNTNPFWGDTPEETKYKTALRPLRTEGIVKSYNYSQMYRISDFNGALCFAEDLTTLQSAASVISYTTLSNSHPYTKIGYNYYKALNHFTEIYFYQIQNAAWFAFYDEYNGVDSTSWLDSDELEVYQYIRSEQIPNNIKCLECIIRANYNGEDYDFHQLIPYIETIDNTGTYTLSTGLNIISEVA